MAETTINEFPFPNEFQEPYFESFRNGYNQMDESLFANAENGNLIYEGGGSVSWDAGTNTLTIGADIKVSGFTTGPFFAVIPAQVIELEDGEVAFWVMPRFMQADTPVEVYRSNRVFRAGVRLNDIRLLVSRVGDTLFFGNGGSLLDGQSGTIFGAGLGGGGGGSVSLIDSPLTTITVTNPAGPTTSLETTFAGSGGNLGVANSSARSDHTHAGGAHDHEPQLKIEPGAGVSSLNLNADAAVSAKTLLFVAIYRNGKLMSEGDEVVINLGLKTASLVNPSLLTDRFLINRVAS